MLEPSGYSKYYLYSEVNELMSFFSINNDTLVAMTSVLAVVISIISMVFTTVFSVLQIKHNKNSVRPISSIQVSDYEDLLSVYILNVGTGPLTINKLRVYNNNDEFDALIDLMPNVEQDWRTFVENVDGWTIPVGGKIVLVEIEPNNDSVRKSLRHILSQTTVTLEYMDVYKTKFKDERMLDFFGRHEES